LVLYCLLGHFFVFCGVVGLSIKDDLQKNLLQQILQALSFLKGKKETKNPSTNPNKGQISF